MALPELTETGDLPAGVHIAILSEVIRRFGRGSNRRKHMAVRLRRVYEIAQETGCLSRLVVFGSFCHRQGRAELRFPGNCIARMRVSLHLSLCGDRLLRPRHPDPEQQQHPASGRNGPQSRHRFTSTIVECSSWCYGLKACCRRRPYHTRSATVGRDRGPAPPVPGHRRPGFDRAPVTPCRPLEVRRAPWIGSSGGGLRRWHRPCSGLR